MRRIALFVIALALAGCAFMDQQIAIDGTSTCIRKSCRDPDARDYTRCEAACRTQYMK